MVGQHPQARDGREEKTASNETVDRSDERRGDTISSPKGSRRADTSLFDQEGS